jgi:hypothetical protein
MPLHVTISVNDRRLNTLHIGRVSGGTHEDDVNSYLVVGGSEPQSPAEWSAGVGFDHRYGDGAEVCVMKAIEAMRKND